MSDLFYYHQHIYNKLKSNHQNCTFHSWFLLFYSVHGNEEAHIVWHIKLLIFLVMYMQKLQLFHHNLIF